MADGGWRMADGGWRMARALSKSTVRHCEERSDEAISLLCHKRDCFAALAMTNMGSQLLLNTAVYRKDCCQRISGTD
jgi:hypothetical protein